MLGMCTIVSVKELRRHDNITIHSIFILINAPGVLQFNTFTVKPLKNQCLSGKHVLLIDLLFIYFIVYF